MATMPIEMEKIEKMIATVKQLRAENAKLRAALEPVARLAKTIMVDTIPASDDSALVYRYTNLRGKVAGLTTGDLQRIQEATGGDDA